MPMFRFPLTRSRLERRKLRRCVECGTMAERMVYADNGLDYCRECFLRVQRITRIQSIGRRATDLDPAKSNARQRFW
jgi:hypothetical protein